MNVRLIVIFTISLMASIGLPNLDAYAQSAVNLQITDSPREYVGNFLNEAGKEGAPRLRRFLSDMGYLNTQTEAVLAGVQNAIRKDENITVKIIEEIDNSDVLRQVYAYSHFGGNAWFFWRFDFVNTSKGWVLSSFIFNSEYSAVIASSFHSERLVSE